MIEEQQLINEKAMKRLSLRDAEEVGEKSIVEYENKEEGTNKKMKFSKKPNKEGSSKKAKPVELLIFPLSTFEKLEQKFFEMDDYFEKDEIRRLVENMHTPIPGDINDFTLKLKSIRKINAENEHNNVRLNKHSAFVKTLKSPNRSVSKFYGAPLDSFSNAMLERFDFSYGLFGNGVYFTSDPVLSAKKCNHNYLLLCHVVIGKYWTIHCSGMNYLDFTEISRLEYDSVYGLRNSKKKYGGSEHDEFVIYDRNQAIPLYLIEFERIESQNKNNNNNNNNNNTGNYNHNSNNNCTNNTQIKEHDGTNERDSDK